MTDQEEDQKTFTISNYSEELDKLVKNHDRSSHIALGVLSTSFGLLFLNSVLPLITIPVSLGSLFWAFLNAEKAKNVEKKKDKVKEGEIIEIKIAQILKFSFNNPETKLFSCLENNRLFVEERKNDLDIALVLPSKKTFFISVIAIANPKSENIKVFFDGSSKILRYRKGKTGKKDFLGNPVNDFKQQTYRLLQNQKGLFQHIPYQIIVFDEPVNVYIHPDTPANEVERKTYMKIDGVYVVALKDLVPLITALNQPKKKRPRYTNTKKGKLNKEKQNSVRTKAEQKPQEPLS